MEIPKKVAGVEAPLIIELFKSFLTQKAVTRFENGQPSYTPKQVNIRLVADILSVSPQEASRIHLKLIEEGWIDAVKLTPTKSGMGLSQYVDRPKLLQADADAIVAKVVDWAHQVNAAPGARVKVRTMHLYGSLHRRAKEVRDIDLFVEFTTMELGDDMRPEDFDREGELCQELAAISEYLSPASELERKSMSDEPMAQIFPRS